MVTREIKFTIEEAAIPEFIAAFCTAYKYQATVDSNPDENGLIETIANPETREAFTKRKIKEYALDIVNAYKINKAQQELVVTPVEGDVVGI